MVPAPPIVENKKLDSIEVSVYAQDGGLAVWQAGWGYPVGKWGTLGISYERAYYYLHRAKIARVFGSTFTNSVDTTDIRFGGNGLKLGVMLPNENITVGCYGEYFFEGTASEQDTVYSGASIADTVNLPSSSFKILPASSSSAPSGRLILLKVFLTTTSLPDLPLDSTV